MMQSQKFALHENLASKIDLFDLPLSKVLMEDEQHYPWVILVPQRPDLSKIMDLEIIDQLQLIKEIDALQRLLWQKFHPTQLNVAAIGNKTPQLHIHIIARFIDDPAWPGTVWDHPIRASLETSMRQERIDILRGAIDLFL